MSVIHSKSSHICRHTEPVEGCCKFDSVGGSKSAEPFALEERLRQQARHESIVTPWRETTPTLLNEAADAIAAQQKKSDIHTMKSSTPEQITMDAFAWVYATTVIVLCFDLGAWRACAAGFFIVLTLRAVIRPRLQDRG